MAQLNITLNQDEILQLLSADREDAFRTLLQESLNSVLKAESQEQRTYRGTGTSHSTRWSLKTTPVARLLWSRPWRKWS